MKKLNRCKVLTTSKNIKIKLTEMGNYTYADINNKIYKLPYNLEKAIEFLKHIGII